MRLFRPPRTLDYPTIIARDKPLTLRTDDLLTTASPSPELDPRRLGDGIGLALLFRNRGPLSRSYGQARPDQPEDFGSNLGGQGLSAFDHFGEVGGKKCGQGGVDLDVSQYTRLDSLCRNSLSGQGEETHRETLSHALPTFSSEDLDLARIVAIWDHLTEQVKRRLLELLLKEWSGNRVGD